PPGDSLRAWHICSTARRTTIRTTTPTCRCRSPTRCRNSRSRRARSARRTACTRARPSTRSRVREPTRCTATRSSSCAITISMRPIRSRRRTPTARATTTDPCGRVNYASRTEIDEGQTVGKLDYQWSSNHSLFGRYMATSYRQPPPFSLIDNVLTTTVGGRDNLAQSFTLGDNYILSTHAVNAFRFAFNRTAIHRTSQDFFSYPDVGVNTFSYMPHYLLLTITGGFSLGGGTESESTFRTNTLQFGDDLQIIKGDHQFAVGGSAAYWKSTSLANVRSPGMFSFDG